MDILYQISTAIRKGNSTNVTSLIERAIIQNITPHSILNDGLLAGMKDVSVLFKKNEIYIPEVLVASNAMNIGTALLRPLLLKNKAKSLATIVIGTVKGDLHDIGKNIVAIMLESAGFRVIDLGVDVLPETFVAKASEHSAQLVAISALLTTTMHMMKITVDKIRNSELKKQVKILIGGAPVTAHFAKLIDADSYAEDASSAVDVAKQILNMGT